MSAPRILTRNELAHRLRELFSILWKPAQPTGPRCRACGTTDRRWIGPQSEWCARCGTAPRPEKPIGRKRRRDDPS